MAKWKFELNRSGVAELLKCSEMKSILDELGSSVQSAAGGFGSVGSEGYAYETSNKGTRLVATVWADTSHARRSNMKHNSLLKALGSVKRQ